MKKGIVEINNKEYIVLITESEEERVTGLLGLESLPEDAGMLFVFEEPQTVLMWMYKTLIPLDIIFINDDEEVISVYLGQPNDRTIAEEDNVKYVLEINLNSGIQEEDEIDIEEEEDESIEMEILDEKGNTQAVIEEGSRIFSRKNTRTLIRMAKKAKRTKKESDYKRLGKKIFEFLDILDNKLPEYALIES